MNRSERKLRFGLPSSRFEIAIPSSHLTKFSWRFRASGSHVGVLPVLCSAMLLMSFHGYFAANHYQKGFRFSDFFLITEPVKSTYLPVASPQIATNQASSLSSVPNATPTLLATASQTPTVRFEVNAQTRTFEDARSVNPHFAVTFGSVPEGFSVDMWITPNSSTPMDYQSGSILLTSQTTQYGVIHVEQATLSAGQNRKALIAVPEVLTKVYRTDDVDGRCVQGSWIDGVSQWAGGVRPGPPDNSAARRIGDVWGENLNSKYFTWSTPEFVFLASAIETQVTCDQLAAMASSVTR